MKQIIKHTVLLMLLCVIQHSVKAQVSESDVKVAFIERFTRFVEWPIDVQSNTTKTAFVITVLGENTFASSLDSLFKGHKIKNLPVELNYTKDNQNIPASDILIICNSEKNNLSNILKLMNSEPVLIISDSKGFAKKGTHINMYVESNYIRYEINQTEIEKSGLTISSLLLASAKIVTTND